MLVALYVRIGAEEAEEALHRQGRRPGIRPAERADQGRRGPRESTFDTWANCGNRPRSAAPGPLNKAPGAG